MLSTDLFGRVSGKRMRDIQACLRAYSLALELFDKYVSLPSALNVHYKPDVVYTGLMQLSVNGGYAESTMTDIRLRYGMDAPCGAAFLYRLKTLEYDEWYSRLKGVNDAVLSVAKKLGMLAELGLSLNTEKTRITSAEDGFDFLSLRFVRQYHPSRGKVLTHFFPSSDALARFKERVRFMTAKRFCDDKDEHQLAKELNLFTTGWSNYFNHSNAGRAYTRLQEFVEWKFRQFIRFRHKWSRLAASQNAYREPRSYGLMRLSGRISRSWVKPNAAGRSTSDSRVRENLKHG